MSKKINKGKIATFLAILFILAFFIFGKDIVYHVSSQLYWGYQHQYNEPSDQKISKEVSIKEYLTTKIDLPDKDHDGIPDQFDPHPNGGDRLIPKHFTWEYPEGRAWTWTMPIQSDWYFFYSDLERYPYRHIYVTSTDDTILALANSLKEQAEKSGISPVMLAVSFVQNLPYVGDEYTGYDNYPKYPIEMIVDQTGDCEDSSYLAASLVKAMGYEVVLINPEGHMMIGVKCSNCKGTYAEHEGDKYFVLETTNPGWKLGEMPEKYKGKPALSFDIN